LYVLIECSLLILSPLGFSSGDRNYTSRNGHG